jgi:RHS repeat-associated protein
LITTTHTCGKYLVSRIYTYGLECINEEQIISGAWTPSFYGYDGFGNVRQLTNASGTVTDTYEYDAFGHTFTTSGSTPNNHLYRGEQYDSDLNLYYLRARYYNAATGRFLSRDSEAGKSVDPKSLHRYLYAGGNPVNGIDPSGRADFEEYSIKLDQFLRKAPTLQAWGKEWASCFYALAKLYYSWVTKNNQPSVGDFKSFSPCVLAAFDTFRIIYSMTPE